MNNDDDLSKSPLSSPISSNEKNLDFEKDGSHVLSPCDLIATGYTSPSSPMSSPSSYQKLKTSSDIYLAYVVAIRDPLNFHLDIYWPEKISKEYSKALNYEYSFVTEELQPRIYQRTAYSCHLKGVEIISLEPNDYSNMKEAYIFMSTEIARSGGWVLVSVTDIDVYNRILVNIFDVISRKSLNYKLLHLKSERTDEPIARAYTRPNRPKHSFIPNSTSLRKDYHIVFSESSIRLSSSQSKSKLPNSLVQT